MCRAPYKYFIAYRPEYEVVNLNSGSSARGRTFPGYATFYFSLFTSPSPTSFLNASGPSHLLLKFVRNTNDFSEQSIGARKNAAREYFFLLLKVTLENKGKLAMIHGKK